MPEPTSRASGPRATNETGPPVSGRVEESEVVGLALAVGVAEGLAVGISDGELGARYPPPSPHFVPAGNCSMSCGHGFSAPLPKWKSGGVKFLPSGRGSTEVALTVFWAIHQSSWQVDFPDSTRC